MLDQTWSPERPEVFSKFKAASDILNNALDALIDKCVVNTRPFDLCLFGDQFIESECGKIYTKGNIFKGVAFPTCISVNDCICHYSPEAEDGLVLKAGDIVKIELGAHIDECPVLLAHTLVIPAGDATAPITGELADLMQCAYTASDLAYHSFKVDADTVAIADNLEKAFHEFGVSSVEGTISFQLGRGVLGSDKYILLNPSNEHKAAKISQKIGLYDIFAIDIAVTKGSGKFTTSTTIKPTLYRQVDNKTNYQLKSKSSRNTLTTIQQSFGKMAFHARSLAQLSKSEQTKDASSSRPNYKLGLLELTKQGVITSYEPLFDKDKTPVVRFMFTVILLPNGPLRITRFKPLPSNIQCNRKLQDLSLVSILEDEPRKKKSPIKA